MKDRLSVFGSLTAKEIRDKLNPADGRHKYRREHDYSYNLPIFRALYRLVRRGDLLTRGRNPGTFIKLVYIPKEKIGFSDWTADPIDEKEKIERMVEKPIASPGVTVPVHVSKAAVIKWQRWSDRTAVPVRLLYAIGALTYRHFGTK